MESPANGIFFSCRAPLMAGRRRQETRCGRPRALPPPALPNGGVRRGGSNVPERFRRRRGRMSRFGSEQAAGCSLRGKGAMSGKRQDLICGLASTPAPARPILAEAGSACVVARIEPGLPVRAPDGALAPSPGIGSEAPVAHQARLRLRRPVPKRGDRSSRTGPGRGVACRAAGGPKRRVGDGRFGPRGRSGEERKAGAAPGGPEGPRGVRKGTRKQRFTSRFRGRGTGFPGAVLLAITVVIRSKMSISVLRA